MYKFNNAKGAVSCDNCQTIICEDCGPFKEGVLEDCGPSKEEVDICDDCKKDCGHSKDYRGLRPPRCNKGLGCDTCREIRNKNLDYFVELIRRS